MLWLVFGLVVVAMLAVDLGVLHRKAREVRLREALAWVGVWVGLALLFMVLVWVTRGQRVALEFLTCYLIEESLSVDNLFVFLVIFSYFNTPSHLQHKCLFWGIIGAVILRGIFIAVGVAAIQRVEWLVYVLGVLLVVTGIRLGLQKDRDVHPERNPVLRLFRRVFPVSENYDGNRFFVRRVGRMVATPLFVVLIAIESTDVVFAIDSVPAALSITLDPFVVYTSNVFAILGLRSLYFAIAGIMPMFVYLHYGLSAILVFTGAKMLVSHVFRVPIGAALGVVGGILLLSVAASMIRNRLASSPIRDE